MLDHEVEPPLPAQVLDQRLVNLDAGDAPPDVRQHAGMRIDTDQLDPGPVQRSRQPARTDAQVEHRWPGGTAPIQPRPEVGGLGQRRVQVGESRIWIPGIVPDPRGGYLRPAS